MADDVLLNKAAAIHDYQKLNLDIVRRIVVDHLDDFLTFSAVLLRS